MSQIRGDLRQNAKNRGNCKIREILQIPRRPRKFTDLSMALSAAIACIMDGLADRQSETDGYAEGTTIARTCLCGVMAQ